MASTGGKVSFLGITPEFIATTGTVSAQNGTILGLGQVWKGAGQTYFGSAGQSLAGNLAGSAVNIALNSEFGTNVPGPNGIPLNSGANILASTITPYVTSTVAAGINQQLQQSLQSAGPFGPVLSSLGTGLVNQAFQGLTNSIASATSTATNYKMFPGGGQGEIPADYGGSAYTLTDIVFSLRRANQGPQALGDDEAVNDPKVSTTVPANVGVSSEGAARAVNPLANDLKSAAMRPDVDGLGTNSPTPFRTAEEQIYDRAKQGEIVIIQDGPNGIIYRPREIQKNYLPR